MLESFQPDKSNRTILDESPIEPFRLKKLCARVEVFCLVDALLPLAFILFIRLIRFLGILIATSTEFDLSFNSRGIGDCEIYYRRPSTGSFSFRLRLNELSPVRLEKLPSLTGILNESSEIGVLENLSAVCSLKRSSELELGRRF